MTSEPVTLPRQRRRVPALFLLAALAVATAGPGCEHDEAPDSVRESVALRDLPSAARDAAAKALPGVTLGDAWKNVDRTTKALHSYEIRGKAANGKTREVRVSPAGVVLEIE